MTVSNAAIGDALRRLADLLEIEGANTFRVRAYRDAAHTVTDLPQSVASMLAAGDDLTELPGIGEDLASKLEEIARTGRLALLEEVEGRTPEGLAELLTVPGLGPKRVRMLHDALGVTGRAELAAAVEAGRVRGLPGFGAKTEDTIRRALARGGTGERRFRLSDAEAVAEALVAHLKGAKGLGEVVVAGSYRRRRETVGDLDVVATCTAKGSDVMDRFAGFGDVEEVLGRGPTRATVRLRTGLQVDLRVVPEESFGAALHYFTGSKAHSVALRGVAQDRGLKINEYGIFRGGGERIAGRTEAEFYGALGLPYFEPELRENRGEFEAAREGRLPKLVTLKDIRGNLHAHTTWSDGRASPEAMAAAAKALGYEYLAITDHSRRVTVAHGLDAKRLAQQIEAIDRLNAELDGLVLLKSCEVDILEDGTLDLPDEVLKRLDLGVCSIHSKFNLPREKQTERIIRAMDSPYFDILAHPTGRMVNGRPGYEVDLERVMAAALERGCFLEVNGQPDRLDLSDVNCQMAKAMGLKLAVSSDAHSAAGLELMRFGIDQARRGWLEPDDVLNTRGWPELRRLLRRA